VEWSFGRTFLASAFLRGRYTVAMNRGQKKTSTIDEYITQASKQSQPHLRTLYGLLRKAAPKATESIKWRAPVFEEKRILFAFYAYTDHLNFMPTPAVIDAFKKELAGYQTGKGSVSFPYDQPLPKTLITKMAKLRLKEVREQDARWM
jgi:uncharacterized protein YdhG (YjbR/CyaY superfamily)